MILSSPEFKYFFEYCPISIAILDLDERVIAANPAFYAMIGYPVGQLKGRHWSEFTYPDDIETQRKRVASLSRGRSFHLRKRYRSYQDEPVWVDVYATLVHDLEGRPLYHLGLIHECSEEVEALDKLKKSESRFRTIIDRIPGGIICVDSKHWVQFMDSTTIANLKLDLPEKISIRLEDLGLPDEFVRPCIEAVDRVFNSREPADIELFWMGRRYRLELQLDNLGSSQDFVLALVRDVTSSYRRRIENRRRLDKAEAMSRASIELARAGLDIDRALEVIVHLVTAVVGEGATIALLSDDGQKLDGVAAYHADEAMNLIGEKILEAALFSPSGFVFSTLSQANKAFFKNNLPGSFLAEILGPEHRELIKDVRIHHLLAAPIRIEQKVVGSIVAVSSSLERPFTGEDEATLQGIADRAGLTLAMAKLFGENQKQAEELRRLNEELEEKVAERTKELEEVNRKLYEQATHDSLTSLPNRRQFDLRLSSEVRRCRRSARPLAVIMIDIDHFKAYNDLYGHQQGDSCLRQVAFTISSCARRATDLVARYGGEEFVAVLAEMDYERAFERAEAMRNAVWTAKIPHGSSVVGPWVTISLGLVCAVPGSETQLEWWVRCADEALYESKRHGRNRVTAWHTLKVESDAPLA